MGAVIFKHLSLDTTDTVLVKLRNAEDNSQVQIINFQYLQYYTNY